MKKFTEMSMISRIMLVVETAAVVIAGVLSILVANDIVLTQMAWYVALMCFIIVLGLAWIAIILVRRIKNRAAKWIVGILAAMILFIGMNLGIFFSEIYGNFVGVERYKLTAPGGESIVIVSQYINYDEEKWDQLYPDMTPEEVFATRNMDEYASIVYRAYPGVAGMFYRADREGDGVIIQSADSDARLLFKWRVENENYPDGAFVWKADEGWMVETADAEPVLMDAVQIAEFIDLKADVTQAYIYLDPETVQRFDRGEICFDLQ